MRHLPEIASEADFDAFVEDEAASGRVLAELADHLGIIGPMSRPERGSALVGMTDTEVVKLMAPQDLALALSERACLAGLDGRLPIPTPRLLDAGEVDGWPWLRMSRLEGDELVDVWPRLSESERLGLATQLGEALSVLHGLEAPERVQRLDWQRWCGSRLAGLGERQRSRGCPQDLWEQLDDFVGTADLSPGPEGWLHTEVMLEHLLVQPSGAGWRLSGLFDFEPSWVAPVTYEFASVGLFFSAGQASVLGEVFRAYGSDEDPKRLFAFAMMHRYANLGWYHRRLGGPTDLSALADAWFGHG